MKSICCLNYIVKSIVMLLWFTVANVTYAQNENSVDDIISTSGEVGVKTYLHVSKAFKTNVEYLQDGSNVVNITITPAPHYYLYKSKISLTYNNGTKEELKLSPGLKHTDDFMGTQEIYFRPVKLNIELKDDAILTYQGCTVGMCYPPQQLKLLVPTSKIKENDSNIQNTQNKIATSTFDADKSSTLSVTSFEDGYHNILDQKENLIDNIKTIFIFLIIGISLSFTPCVFPMYPVLSLILFGGSKNNVSAKTFWLSLFFVLGIAIAYTILGILAGFMGTKIHTFLQQPFMLILFSFIFLLLSLAMLGVYNFQMPNFISSYLQKLSEKQKGGTYVGCFTMGLISAVICSPCTTAPVSASLLYTIQQGQIFWGAIDLFFMGFGMGIPMLVIGAVGKKMLPKAGNWMTTIKELIGIFSLSIPLILLDRILPSYVFPCGIVLLSIIAITLIIKRLSLRLSLPISILLIAITTWFTSNYINSQQTQNSNFEQLATLTQIKNKLASTTAKHQNVLIDFYASWCTACKQYEVETFADTKVKEQLSSYELIRVDLSDPSNENENISHHFNLVGLPSVALIDKEGKVTVLSGFYPAQQLLDELKKIQ